MKFVRLSILALACLATATPLQTAPTDSHAAELKSQVEALSRQLDQLSRTTSPQTQAALASQHWQQMQEYMRSFPGMGCPMCGRMMHGPGMHGGMMGSGMTGCPMMGGAGNGWPMPSGMTTDAYCLGMGAEMKAMRDRIARAQAATDPVERERLLREAWDGMYRNMQTMRGMGWMWTPADQARAALPDASSKGARLVGTYCSQCHAAPSPSLHTAMGWSAVASRMRGHMQDAGGAGQGVKIPSTGEFEAIVDYLGKHGR